MTRPEKGSVAIRRVDHGASEVPIRVLHLGSPSGLYGAERWILALIKHLPVNSVYSVVGAIRDASGLGEIPLCREAGRLGFDTVEFEAQGKLSLSAIREIRAYIRANDIHVLHTHGYKTDIIGCIAAVGLRCKHVSTPHGWSANAGLKLQIYEKADRIAFQFIDIVAPLSPDLSAGLARIPGLSRKLVMIRNGVDLSEIDAAREASINKSPMEREGFVIGYIGQLIVRKQLDILLRAYYALDIPDKYLWIVGDGPQSSELSELNDSLGGDQRVQFLGFREDRLSLLSRFDVFVLPSSLEGIPRCLMEALGMGTPVVASDIPGTTELIRHRRTGLLFDCGNVESLTNALNTIAKDAALRESVTQNGRTLIDERYSAKVMGLRYSQLYSMLCRSESSREEIKSAFEAAN